MPKKGISCDQGLKGMKYKDKRYGETKPTKQYESWKKYAPLTRQIKIQGDKYPK